MSRTNITLIDRLTWLV